MTVRLCIFGNSHVAALREAWQAAPGRWPGIEADFVGAHKGLLLETEHRDGHLVPTTARARQAFELLAGRSSVDLADYDGFVVAGCMVSVMVAAMTYRDARWPDLPSLMDEDDISTMAPVLMSRRAARASVVAGLANRLGPQFAEHLRAGTDRPVWIASQPRVSAAILTRPRPTTRALEPALAGGDTAGLSDLFDEAATCAAAAVGATFLPQPAETRTRDILTALPYTEGARRLSASGRDPQPKDDVMHANAAYGAAVLSQIERATTKLASRPAPAVHPVRNTLGG